MGDSLMSSASSAEGGLGAPVRHPLNQDAPEFWSEDALNAELERVFDICHGCRRCVSLCNAFPTLFDLIDESDTMEVDGVAKADYNKVVGQCYLCDLCYMTKCPYVPPHEWNVDFPHLMLRAKAVQFKKGDTRFRDRLITSTDMIGKLATKPGLNSLVNAGTGNSGVRKLLDGALGIHQEAKLPRYHRQTARVAQAVKVFEPDARRTFNSPAEAVGRAVAGEAASNPAEATDGTATGEAASYSTETAGGVAANARRVALFTTCYCNYNEPFLADSVIKVLEHNNVTVSLPEREHCCGMPKLELGDLKSVTRLKEQNIPVLYGMVEAGFDIVAAVPSCVLMFKQELPLMFPEDEQVQTVAKAFYDPFEYLHKLHKVGALRTDFKNPLGKVSYHVACHQRVQNIGPRTRQILELIPDTAVTSIERCSGHDGTYGMKSESLQFANKIAAPVVRQIKQQEADHYGSDCPVAGRHLENNLGGKQEAIHPIDLLRQAYGL
ncbi:MAG: heterodisulfide reductase-related iron-sulfur binding cluster [Pseudohongiellaceae bacterium]